MHDSPEPEKKTETVVFGFWTFLMSDLIIFGILFATYASSHNMMGMADGPGPKDLFNLESVIYQTLFLLLSSLTFGISSLIMKYKQNKNMMALWLIITFILGFLFLYFEITDLSDIAKSGGVPTRSGWLSSMYALLGLHGLHIGIGLVWLLVTIFQIYRRGFDFATKSRVLCLGVYWHFLDLIWIGIFSVIFLFGTL
ncbi:cytochrome c oxidase subunit 3 [uncultured Chryseobacterium sp.]|uniref:cytochrome c oxidase subunit 3 n=2 Tax=uncultured Chryseobacterium sp. TaxID=259322 RepID=UPI0025ED3788|nr:cytochrome c oxidase subunit 3 [uncultured Chryseobacterium sp.]